MAILRIPEDDDIFPMGKFKGEKYANVPASYFVWLKDQKWINNWPYIVAYMVENADSIALEAKKEGHTNYDKFNSR